ncbi:MULTISPECIES: TonB-dependent receptor [unclassified Novosphingobium]|uniref:TonB-dependent receptor n=1 Tax=unclassified Novosphingobium TaxID=2644732 RepID=UPI0014948F15|nr:MULTISPECIES: TonB-dependent receptor [unclassified Novosphingobium]MBB3358726.1 iron complex outermembrane receptor protein [Novosphingobium sp. BK256]MBB3375087.1 iron complex outermembrane receptor protein [Novosphingobium sp. BK280]MBB3379225.1 iron complex outermembrane receptor protein [Novosphingobium sp. BK258]MBB3420919.1 iron complex outermembrane receptor protein [Novosphingobium sp. BK267]MBB3449508.1 iron complex outermembrane receptor protein [Novosphingobium sp. BK352]
MQNVIDRRWRRAVPCALALATSLGIANPAWADSPDAASVPVAGTDALRTAGDIVVTARQRPEPAQSVPAALSVVDGAWLDRSLAVNTQALTTLVPALTYSSANPRNTAFTIRGLGSSVVAVSQANDGLEPGVGFYVDGVYHARPATAAFDFADVERVEVLRGPQGTLFGKNTTAGAIAITSRLPSFTPAANEEVSVGERRLVQAKAMATGPLIDGVLAYRLSGLLTRRDGVIHNVRTGADQNSVDNQALRGQLLFTPSASVQLRVVADYARFGGDCCTQVYLRVGTSLRSPARQYAALAAAAHYAPPSANPYDRVTDIDAGLGVNTNEGGIAATLDWHLGGATLTSISAWRFWNWDAANDRDYTGLPIQTTQHIPSRQDQVSQELRLASDGQRALSYVAGLYYFRQVITGHPISIYGPYGAPWLLGRTTSNGTAIPTNLLDGYGQGGDTRFAVNSYAAFAEANWTIVPRLTLTGGLRQTWEDKNGQYTTSVFGGPQVTNAALIAAQLSVLRPQAYAASTRDSSLSGRANLAWQVSDTVMAYGGYAQGFKSGGINMSGLPLDSANQPVLATAVIRPERNITWEGGIKSQWWDRHLLLNLAAYRTTVRDFQATVVDSGQTVALRGYLSNIPRVRVQGVEADAALHWGGLVLTAGLAYADGRYTDYPKGPCPLEVQTAATTACNLTGKALTGLSRWSETLGVDYRLPMARGEWVLHSDTAWRSSYNGDPSLSRYTSIDGYALTNASLAWRSRRDGGPGVELGVFARNLFKANYIQNLTIQAGNSGLILGTPSDPRTLGVTFRAWQ